MKTGDPKNSTTITRVVPSQMQRRAAYFSTASDFKLGILED